MGLGNLRNSILVALMVILFVESRAQVHVAFTSSNLPIIIINTHGGTIVDDPKIPADMGIIDNGPGVRNNTTDPFNDFDGKIGIEIRGSTSQMFPKKQYGIEVQDINGNGIDASLLGLPKKDDWVLFAPYNDKSLMRDALSYKLGRDQGRYASRSRYCEVVINDVYQGIYVLLEKIKRDKNRVNVDKLDPEETTGDDLTGGYIIKIDKTSGSGGEGWSSPFPTLGSSSGQITNFIYDYPKQEDIAPEQKAYIQNYVHQFEVALSGTNFKDTTTGYSHYIDVPSFIDFLIMSEITKNPDAYRLSTYFYKKKDSDGGKLFMGPIWDFNLAFGNVNYCTQGTTDGFVLDFNSVCPDDYWQIPFWWNRLLQDESFHTKLAARWISLRGGNFSNVKIIGYVDSVNTVLAESQLRNFSAWPVLGVPLWPNYYVGQSFYDEVSWLKTWIIQRLEWLDANLPNLTTGIADNGHLFSIHTFPNPFTHEVQWEYEIDQPGILQIDFFDILGRKVGHFEKSNEKEGKYAGGMSIGGLAAGTYITKARFRNKVVTERVIKKPD